jgi:hypothetical protein
MLLRSHRAVKVLLWEVLGFHNPVKVCYFVHLKTKKIELSENIRIYIAKMAKTANF